MRFPKALFCSALLLFTFGCGFNQSSRSASSQNDQNQNGSGNLPPVPAAQYLYSANGIYKSAPTGSISEFKIDNSTGVLTEVNGSPIDSGPQPYNLATDVGRNLYLANPTLEDSNLRVFPINASTGALNSPVLSDFIGSNYEQEYGCCPGPVAVDHSGRHFYVGNTENNTVSSYLIDQSRKVLIQFGEMSFAPGHFPSQLIFNGDSNQLFVLTDAGAPTSLLYVVFRDDYSGALNLASGGPYTFSVANGIALSADNHYVYVVDNPESGATLHVLYIEPDATLKEISSTVLGATADALAIAVDSTGHYVAIAESGSASSIATFKIQSDGTLRLGTTTPVNATWNLPSLAFDESGKFLYASDDSSAQIFGFVLNPTSGELAAISGSPWHTGDQPHSLLVVQPK